MTFRLASVVLMLAVALIVSGCTDPTFGSMKRSDRVHFSKHSFSTECGETIGCKIIYAARVQRHQSEEKLAPPLREDHLTSTRHAEISIPNFPEPAIVTWRSSDGQRQRAEVDMSEIFKDRIALHRVPVKDILGVDDQPMILLVVNDRTIRVYIKTGVWLNYDEIQGNPYSNFREDVTLAFEKTY